MLTNQIVKQEILGKSIRQQTKNKFLSLTDVLENFKSITPDLDKRIADYFDLSTTKAKIEQVYSREFSNSGDLRDLSYADIHSSIVEAKRGNNGGTYAHPLIFLDFCMWLSLDFWYYAMKVIENHLIDYRIDAGDDYKEMCRVFKEAINPINPDEYKYEAMMINDVCFNLLFITRNELPEDDLKKLNKAQEINIKLLKKGILNRQDRKKKIKDFLELY